MSVRKAGVNQMVSALVFTGLSASVRMDAKLPANGHRAGQLRLRVDVEGHGTGLWST
ncbi:hypothetical protein ACH4U5_09770 [Streptomyces sp. NPDC020858]|uniref:hypothetical protein n=1 Tax=Streptomyces sp. NPDC020858 TaxID=3365097 RepID=UPI0037987916